MRTPLALLWALLALALILPSARAQRSRGQSQARRPSTEAPAYDDYYYDEEGAEEEGSKKSDKSSSSQAGRGGAASGSSSSSRGGAKAEPAAEDDYDAPPPPSKSSASSTAKPSSFTSKSKPGPGPETKPPAAASAGASAANGGDSDDDEPASKKSGPISPSTLFLAPRKNRLHRPNVHYAARPRPTLPSFIKHPPPLGAISTTVTPKPRSAIAAATEEPKVARSTAKPKASSKRAGSSAGFSGASGRKRDRSTTESPASTDGDRGSGRFGGSGKSKNTSRPRFRAGSTA